MERIRRPRSRPDNEVPVPVVVDSPVLSTGDHATWLESCRVYSTGVELEFVLLTRDPERRRPHQLELLVGVEFADGRWTSTYGAQPDVDPEAPVLHAQGGGGSDNRMSESYYLSPVPPEGPCTVYFALPDTDLADGEVVLAGARLNTAAAAVRELWPWRPRESSTAPVHVPVPPPGSWFRSHPEPEMPG